MHPHQSAIYAQSHQRELLDRAARGRLARLSLGLSDEPLPPRDRRSRLLSHLRTILPGVRQGRPVTSAPRPIPATGAGVGQPC